MTQTHTSYTILTFNVQLNGETVTCDLIKSVYQSLVYYRISSCVISGRVLVRIYLIQIIWIAISREKFNTNIALVLGEKERK